MTFIDLRSRAKFCLSGPDAVRYLNGQVTANVATLKPGQSRPSLVCSHKGRVEGEIVITSADEALFNKVRPLLPEDPRSSTLLLIDAPGELRDSLEIRLGKYIIADDCELTDVTAELDLWQAIEPTPTAAPTAEGRCWDVSGQVEQLGLIFLSPEAAEALRLSREIPTPAWGTELTPETLPQEAIICPDQPSDWITQCLDFHKGCYQGQEIVSRLRSVGQVNKRLMALAFTPGAHIAAGDAVEIDQPDGNRYTVGHITSAHQPTGRALALIKRTALEAPHYFSATERLTPR